MASINTLFKKGYLLAGVIMAANIFVGNEMKATIKTENNMYNDVYNENNEEIQPEDQNDSNNTGKNASSLESFFNFVLNYENLITFFGGALFSVANNYLKWWDYNPGLYCNLRIGCLGLRSKRLLNGIFQFEINFNLWEGAFWLFPGGYNFIKAYKTTKEKSEKRSEDYLEPLYISFLVGNNSIKNKNRGIITLILSFLVQGFVSMPLTLHLPKINLSISISLDSIIWGVTGMILELKAKKRREKERKISLAESKKIGGDDNENYD